MTSPADEEDQDALAAESEASVEDDDAGDDAGGEDEQDDLAAEWETMVGEGEEGEGEDDDAGGTRESTRVLNQDEIDSLLGFDEEHEDVGEKSAPKRRSSG